MCNLCNLFNKPTPIISPVQGPYLPFPDELDEKEKFAFIAGVNKYAKHPNATLNGCVNDVETYRYHLINYYKFHPDNIRVLTDYRAEEDNIVEHMEWLVAHENSILVCTFSGHGSTTRDRNGDELKGNMDQFLCGTDMNWDNPKLLDDNIGEIFDKLPLSSKLTFFVDACHSESMSRSFLNPFIKRKHPTKIRYLRPPRDIEFRSESTRLPTQRIGGRATPLNHTIVAGCDYNSTSADAYINGKYQGAFTAYIAKYLRSGNTWPEHFPSFIKDLKRAGFDQHPHVNGPKGSIIT